MWWPVFFGIGCALCLGWGGVLPDWQLLMLGLVIAVPILARRAAVPILMAAWAASAMAGGVMVTAWRVHAVAAPILAADMATTIEGRVIGISRSSGNNPRILLDRVTVYDSAVQPDRIRIALTGPQAEATVRPGDVVRLHARIAPPSGPVEPHGFDFRQMAWFQRLGAVGYSTAPVLILAPEPATAWIRLLQARQDVSDAIVGAIDGPRGGFATALLTGDRAHIDQDTLEDLRASNLAHLLAISGMHMGMLTGFVFALVRFGLSAVPGLAAQWPIRKLAAVAAILAGVVYLVMSGGAVATQRAFVMVTVVLFAVLIDRPAFTLRAVALAAAIILITAPESIAGPGFQMSFAATAALIATFEWLRGQAWWRDEKRGWVTRLRPALALFVASSVAGAATAPISAFHFGQISQLGLLANLMAVPLMGSVIMPAGVIAAVLAPIGLAEVPLWVMSLGIGGVLAVADFVAGMEGAVRLVPMGPLLALCLVSLGGVWLILWRGAGRWLGVVAMLAALPIWGAEARPDILISDDGMLVGILTEDGRALNRMRGNGFAAERWAENDGQPLDRARARDIWPGEQRRGYAFARLSGGRDLIWSSERSAEPSWCRTGVILVLPRVAEPLLGPCLQFTQATFAATGAIALTLGSEVSVITTRDARGPSPWARYQ
nr:ComEC/Rec2 family competence protein [Rubricella aquisinus]